MDKLLSPENVARSGRLKTLGLAVLLAGMAIVGPLVAYAGVTVIYPSTTVTTDIDTTPPITFAAGADHALAVDVGFAGALSTIDNAGAFTLTASGLSGGSVTIDKLTNIVANDDVGTFKLQVATALVPSGGFNPDTLKVRLWTGGTAPTADGDSSVCGVLDLEAALNTETSTTCAGNQTVFVQLVYALPSGAAGSGVVSLRPSSIAFV